ncbi:MAG: IPT/TIG domain-containing protein [Acidobacteria bacterium]|nr:IPT/TIG domain-containing protein [Acidobacteriota bacterium]MBI3424503.1 IPT/TIG domain-containing protein [Acidobacteriota bacterium]
MFRSLNFTRSLLHKRRANTLLTLLSLVLGGLLITNWQFISNATASQTNFKSQIPKTTAVTPPVTTITTLRAAQASAFTPTLTQDNLEQQQGCTVGCGATVPATATTGQAVAFAATATPAGCATQPTYDWDFGDGTARSTQQNPSKTYAAPGTFNWRLTVSAGSGSTNISTVAGGVGEEAPARQSPYNTPFALARDPQNRGLYIMDQGGGSYVLRFVNTTNAAVTIGGREIAAGTNRLLAGLGNDDLGDNVPGPQVSLFDSNALTVHPNGNLVYFTALQPARVRVLNVSNTNQSIGGGITVGPGNVATLATINNGDGLNGIAVNANGDAFVASAGTGLNRVYKITAAGGVSNFAGNGAVTSVKDAFSAGPANNIALLNPRAVELDPSGNLYIADSGHLRVIRVDGSGNATLVTQFAQPDQGIGPTYPNGLAWLNGNLYAALGNAQTIVRLTNGQAIVAGRDGVSCDYASSQNNCGDGGPATGVNNVGFFMLGSSGTPPLSHIEADNTGIFIPDQGSIQRGRIRYLNLSGAAVTILGTTINPNQVNTIIGSGGTPPYDGGPAKSGALAVANGVAVDANNNLWISDTSVNRLRFVNRGATSITLFANTPASQVVAGGAIVSVNKDVGAGPTDDTSVNQAGFETPQGLFVNAQGVFIADSRNGGVAGAPGTPGARKAGLIRFVNTTSTGVTLFPNASGGGAPIVVPPGFIRAIAGGSEDGGSIGNGNFALNAKFIAPADVVVAANGDIFVADVGNKAVRKIAGLTGIVSSLSLPAFEYTGLALDSGGRLFVVNNDNGQILRENAAGGGTFSVLATVSKPLDVAVDAGGNAYVTSADHKVFRITSGGQVSTLAGTTQGFDGDNGSASSAKLNIMPTPISIGTITNIFVDVTDGIAVNAAGEIFFNDVGNNRVRRIATGEVSCVRTGTITISGGDNPAPTLTTLTPNVRGVGQGAFTLSLTGTGFTQSSQVRWVGSARPTTYVSPTQLTAAITAADVATAGSFTVTVFNPTPGGGTSAGLNFTVQPLNPMPTINTLAPNTAAVGTSFTLTVTGSGFINSSVVRWENNNRTTTFVNENTLRAQIPASDLATAGVADITVVNPEPGGGTSNLGRFTIIAQNPAPTLTNITPSFVPTGNQPVTVTVNGTGFAFNSVVRLGGQDRPTTFVNNTQLTVALPAADVAAAGTKQITVFTPTPGGGVTSAATLTVGALAVSLSAASFQRDVATAEMIVAMFGVEMATSTVSATGTELPTTLAGTTVKIRDVAGTERLAPLFFVSAGQINYLVPAGTAVGPAVAIVTAGNGKLSVSNLDIQVVSPGLFTANANGAGVPAAILYRQKANGQVTFEEITQVQGGTLVPRPLDLGPAGDVVLIIAFGTGVRGHANSPTAVTCTIGGAGVDVPFAAAQGGLFGLDQLNIGPLPRSLAGRGPVDMVITVDGKAANTVQLNIR